MENPDDTFAGTIFPRSNDWDSWRRVVLQSCRAGGEMEKRLISLETKISSCAKVGAYTHLDARVVRLEEEAGRRRGLWGQVLKALGAIGLVVLGHELSRWIK